MASKKTNPISPWRFRCLSLVLLFLGLVIASRMFFLTIVDRSFLQSQGNARSLRVVDLPAFRGRIYDRNHQVLAVSSPVWAVWAMPQNVDVTSKQYAKLCQLLGVNKQALKNKLQRHRGREFVYIKRQVSPTVAWKIEQLNMKGIYFKREFKRYYPQGEAMSQILGFTNIDDTGIEGLELTFNDWLKGVPGKKRVVKDRLGRIVDEVSIIRQPKPGKHIYLSLDKRIQFIAYRELVNTVKQFKAKSGSVVVLDVTTGELLAMANVPSFNPNIRFKNRDSSYKNSAVTDLFEPGSVIKPFSIASAIDSGKFDADSMVDTSPSYIKVDGNMIRDERANGELSVTQILQRSSNVGVTKLVLASPASQLVDLLRRVGFGQSTGSGFPGESIGMLTDKLDSRPFVLATLGFGYGMSVTALQLVHAYSVFGNGGQLFPVSLLKIDKPRQGKQVISNDIAQSVLNMLEAVVEKGGTGRRARIKGYRIAGKTGTSRIADKAGYAKDRHIASFVGIAPVSHPKIAVAVVIREPKQGSYYGSAVAAPLFARVMSSALRIEGVLPDKLEKG